MRHEGKDGMGRRMGERRRLRVRANREERERDREREGRGRGERERLTLEREKTPSNYPEEEGGKERRGDERAIDGGCKARGKMG